ncbi:kinase-like protein [Exidia glandulosa HHB12029]|uniref:Kinase-like protein n=1 Tax=Exidia glandulosa HHB12029 TaxID=1314781 RepID=A0A165LEF2_EXIGL|nr:kinase-like protein [Exidia glandulosa HHB12029]
MSGIEQRARRSPGFKRVRDPRDLRPYVSQQPPGRRLDPHGTGTFLSPLRALTTHITTTYNICNPSFRYETAHNPRRVLTKPSKPVNNDGYDNDDWDYILYVNDWLGGDSDHESRYLILDILGQGTFGQVVKCQNITTHEIVAVKVVKNKPAYYNQSMMEVTILDMLNKQLDPDDVHHILRMRDHFVHKGHLCLVFELLSSNLYELIKQNSFQGLSTQLVKVFTAQLLDALMVLKDARLIHCDLKPENILLRSLQSPQIKVIDFGSACHERQTVYTYIQSRFYRSPEVLLGCSYNCSIDMWSLGCIAIELFLGLPIFPGTSEYNQVSRIVEMLGDPPNYMIERGKQAANFFEAAGVDDQGRSVFRLKTIEQYSREHNKQEQPGKKYFQYTHLPDIIKNAPLPPSRSSSTRRQEELEKEMHNRMAFIDFCQGLLQLDPLKRWTPQQAKMHPFITGEKFVKPYQQQQLMDQAISVSPPLQGIMPSPASSKHVYGGLVPMKQQQGARPYQDAAAYNQHLAQHQTYTAQQAQAAQASSAYRNPYVTPQDYQQQQQQAQQQQQQQVQPVQQLPTPASQYSASMQPPPSAAQRALAHHGSNGNLRSAAAVAGTNMYGHQSQSMSNPAPPPNSYYPATRNRANTLGTSSGAAATSQLGAAPMSVPNQMDAVPPALARLSQMGALEIPGGGGRNALTPVINRDDAMREWERRGGASAKPTAYPPALEYLSQQAEMGPSNWSHHQHHQQQQRGYAPTQPSGLGYQAHGGAPAGVTSAPPATQADRDAVMGSVRAAAGLGGVSSVAPPAAVYGAPRYDPGPQTLYVPSQGQYTTGVPTSPARAHTQAQQAAAAAYYSPQTAQTQQRNMFGAQQPSQMSPAMSGGTGSGKRASQMDWPR